MNSQELCIGNYVLYADVICKVEGYNNDGFLETNGVIAPISAYDPVILTEKILIDFGFTKKSWKTEGVVIEYFYYIKNHVIVYLLIDSFEIEVVTSSGQFNLHKQWKFVHQLQNIYYDFNKEELILNN
ncbi:hypothetical protein [Elizabethkingia bruuniana]|uniref:hypothetical protein n=1 Tax=Elizabethkingia bruuniana TaxID=1756149 RepID=UPI000BEB2505|nr:hypothetical protein [Elizabethkingia bruuniana]ATL45427.1 hypothetical protein CQS02_20045 [Elizabethkingia miricola]MCL1636299.1 hypothetical protein [Elizabethkingia bruuniana]